MEAMDVGDKARICLKNPWGQEKMTNRLAEYNRATVSTYRARQDRSRPAKLHVGGGSTSDAGSAPSDTLRLSKKYVYGCPSSRATPVWR